MLWMYMRCNICLVCEEVGWWFVNDNDYTPAFTSLLTTSWLSVNAARISGVWPNRFFAFMSHWPKIKIEHMIIIFVILANKPTKMDEYLTLHFLKSQSLLFLLLFFLHIKLNLLDCLPFFSRILTTSTCPHSAASCKGVLPSLSARLALHPAFSNWIATSGWSHLAARNRRLLPLESSLLISARRFSEAETWRVNTGDPFLFRLLAKILHVELVRRIVKLFCGDALFDLFIMILLKKKRCFI